MKKRIIMLICICYSIIYLILAEIIQSIFVETADPTILLLYNLISTLGFGILIGIIIFEIIWDCVGRVRIKGRK